MTLTFLLPCLLSKVYEKVDPRTASANQHLRYQVGLHIFHHRDFLEAWPLSDPNFLLMDGKHKHSRSVNGLPGMALSVLRTGH